MTSRHVARLVVALSLLALAAAPSAVAKTRTYTLGEFKLPDARIDQLRDRFVDQISARYPAGSWAPMKYELSNRDLKLMGLPSKQVLLSHRYKHPTAVYPSGRMLRLSTQARGRKGGGSASAAATPIVAFAGTGYFGIRPGGWLLLMNGGSIGWCSFAHVYGTPGTYKISTAGHCGKVGDTATVIGALGDKTVAGVSVPVLMDIGKFSSSTGDGGIGNDWALITVDPPYQPLVTPTMAFWGGPIGTYTATGEVVSADLVNGGVSVTPNPTLVQQVVHYGHGAGLGAGGTPRSGTAITWRPNYFAFFGAITPGDSGSGSNTLTGDTVGANREAAGINTHIYVDGSLRTGLGLMAGTRATLVAATLANGQIVPYPAPTPVPLP
ncbi:MAG: hypothetical protein QOJ12_67 [Thermoleophilales bacterium]|nr:hypothetical protein [Thermoleophilales bacterium]